MVNIVNQGQLGGGFRHYSGLLPTNPMDGDGNSRASVRLFAVPAANVSAIFRGDIAIFATATDQTANQGGNDIIPNIGTPVTPSVVVGNGGGSLLGNASIAPNIARYVPANTTGIIAGVVVGFGPISLYMAKNGFQFIPALTLAWAYVETDPDVEMAITVPTVPGTAFNLLLNGAFDVQANAGFQQTRFGISGLSLNPATTGTATFPLRLLDSGNQIGNDPTAAGSVASVMFSKIRHFRGTALMTPD